jgi:membrane protein implicated in regulation of membrane protease activity
LQHNIFVVAKNANIIQCVGFFKEIQVDAMWVWGALGLIIIAAEMATGTIYLLWFGISALCMAVALWLFPQLNVSLQVAMYAALSVSSLAIWRLNYQKTEVNHRIGQAQGEEIGRIGTIIEACHAHQNGKIRFTQGLMGSREWIATSEESIAEGQSAKVIAVEGNSLRVSAHI